MAPLVPTGVLLRGAAAGSRTRSSLRAAASRLGTSKAALRVLAALPSRSLHTSAPAPLGGTDSPRRSASASASALAAFPPPLASTAAWGGLEWRFETGELSTHSDGSVVLKAGGTVVLATADSTSRARAWQESGWAREAPASAGSPSAAGAGAGAASPAPRAFPLAHGGPGYAARLEVSYREKQAAAGRIPGQYVKREAAPGEREVALGRTMERALRPLIPTWVSEEIEVNVSVLAADGSVEPELVGLNAAAAALLLAGIAREPAAAVRLGLAAPPRLPGGEAEGDVRGSAPRTSGPELRENTRSAASLSALSTSRGRLAWAELDARPGADEAEVARLLAEAVVEAAPLRAAAARLALARGGWAASDTTTTPLAFVEEDLTDELASPVAGLGGVDAEGCDALLTDGGDDGSGSGAGPLAALTTSPSGQPSPFPSSPLPPPPPPSHLSPDPAGVLRVLEAARGHVERAVRGGAEPPAPGTAPLPLPYLLASARREVEGSLRARGALRADSARVPGSGAVSRRDLDAGMTYSIRAALAEAASAGLRPAAAGARPRRGLGEAREGRLRPSPLPVQHGSALADRGGSQVLCGATVGSRADAQRTESLLEGSDSKGLFVHVSLASGVGGGANAANSVGGGPGSVNGGARALDSAVHLASPLGSTVDGPLSTDSPRAKFRSEVARGRFVERALAAVAPATRAFPFASRVSADVLASDGGSAALTLDAASLALRAAGVPLASPLSGMAVSALSRPAELGFSEDADAFGGDGDGGAGGVGLPGAGVEAWTAVPSWDGSALDAPAAPASPLPDLLAPSRPEPSILVDPDALESALGDMELRIATGPAGLAALELDVRREGGVGVSLVSRALSLSGPARRRALGDLRDAVAEAAVPAGVSPACEAGDAGPRVPPAELAEEAAPEGHAATLARIRVAPSAVSRIVGPGGSAVRQLEETTGARVHVGDDGEVVLWAPTPGALALAKARVEDATGGSLRPGVAYSARVVGLRDFGAIVELVETGARMLLHVSEMDVPRFKQPSDVLAQGQEIQVRCLGRDARGNVVISSKAAADAGADRNAPAPSSDEDAAAPRTPRGGRADRPAPDGSSGSDRGRSGAGRGGGSGSSDGGSPPRRWNQNGRGRGKGSGPKQD